MLRSVTPEMLVMWDRGLHAYDLIDGVCQRGSHVLARLAANVKPTLMRRLADGSYLARIYPSEYRRRKRGEQLWVRIVEYTVTDPALPGYGEVHRLITTLLHPQIAPALELAWAYHERWEIEIAVDETRTHQRLLDRPLRSRKVVGVIQELYGLLIAHYVLRFLMHEAATEADVDPDRISFTHALNVVLDAIPEFQMTVPEQRPRLYRRLLHDLVDDLLPPRRPRTNPRVVKRKMSNFGLKRPQHYHWPQPSTPFQQTVAVI
jgi:hypothetical protein